MVLVLIKWEMNKRGKLAGRNGLVAVTQYTSSPSLIEVSPGCVEEGEEIAMVELKST